MPSIVQRIGGAARVRASARSPFERWAYQCSAAGEKRRTGTAGRGGAGDGCKSGSKRPKVLALVERFSGSRSSAWVARVAFISKLSFKTFTASQVEICYTYTGRKSARGAAGRAKFLRRRRRGLQKQTAAQLDFHFRDIINFSEASVPGSATGPTLGLLFHREMEKVLLHFPNFRHSTFFALVYIALERSDILASFKGLAFVMIFICRVFSSKFYLKFLLYSLAGTMFL
jgi:hypothetical protein